VDEIGRYLFLAGALPYLVLGTAHAFATPLRPDHRRGLTPHDPALAEAMTRSGVLLTRRTDVWRCWVGFNLSHSLGVVMLGATVVLIGISPDRFARDGALFVPMAACAAALYLLIGLRYWFRTPIIGCALSLACFVASWVLLLARRA
jgi:hypothetical protein